MCVIRLRDSSLRNETFLKENLEMPFTYQKAVSFQPITLELDGAGWVSWLRTGYVSESNQEASDGIKALQRPSSKLAANMVACQKLLRSKQEQPIKFLITLLKKDGDTRNGGG
jgi:hypothetical protein